MNTSITRAASVAAIKVQFDAVADAIRSAKTLDDVAKIRDVAAATRAYLESSAAAKAMGDRLESVRADLRALWLLADLRLGDLAKDAKPVDKPAIAASVGVTPRHLTSCERAARVPDREREVIIRNTSSDKPADIKLMVTAGLLPAPVRAAAVATIGDDVDARKAIEAASSAHWAGEAAKRKCGVRVVSEADRLERARADALLSGLAAVGDAYRRVTVAARRYVAATVCTESLPGDIARARNGADKTRADLREAVARLVQAEGALP